MVLWFVAIYVLFAFFAEIIFVLFIVVVVCIQLVLGNLKTVVLFLQVRMSLICFPHMPSILMTLMVVSFFSYFHFL